jgi:small subunit ribosomal protein S4e
LAIVLRDILEFAKNRKEAKIIISQGKVCVDGKVRRNDDFPVGLMDVLSLPDATKYFRVLPAKKGLTLNTIQKNDASFKLCKITNKSILKGKGVQLNFHDGSNVLVSVAAPQNPVEDVFETYDTIKISLPERQIIEHVKLKENNYALITGGKNIGKCGKIVKIEKLKRRKRKDALVTIDDGQGNRYQTILHFVFVIGAGQPLISLPEATPVV